MGISKSFVQHMSLCLLCRNCETVCPSGVQFGFLMEATRGQIERRYEYAPLERRFRDLILHTFTDIGRLRVLTALLRLYQSCGLQKLVRAVGILRPFGRLGKMEALMPSVPTRQSLPQVVPAQEIVERIGAEFPLEPAEPNYEGEVARRWRYADGQGEIGFVSSITEPFCGDCTRARITAAGKLHTCLFSNRGADLRPLLASASRNGFRSSG